MSISEVFRYAKRLANFDYLLCFSGFVMFFFLNFAKEDILSPFLALLTFSFLIYLFFSEKKRKFYTRKMSHLFD